jgi:hypothetical protein
LRFKKYLRTVALILAVVLYATSGSVSAFNDLTKKYENLGIYFYDPNTCDPSSGVEEEKAPNETPRSVGTSVDLNSLSKTANPFTGAKIKPTAIMLHYTAAKYTNDPADIMAGLRSRVEPNLGFPNGRAVQLYVDDTGKIHQLSESLDTKPMQTMTEDMTWNDVSLAIEIESLDPSAAAADHEKAIMDNATQYQSVLGLVTQLMAKYNIKNEQNTAAKKGVFGHHEAQTSNDDPGAAFMTKIRKDLNAPAAASSQPETKKPEVTAQAATTGNGLTSVEITAYTPVKPGDPRIKMEGGYGSSVKGPDGQAITRTLDDVNSGTSKYVTLAGDPQYKNKTYKIPTITYNDINNKSVTLTDVTAVVHDTGGAFKGKPEGRYDIPVGRDYPDSIVKAEPFNGMNKIQLVPVSPEAAQSSGSKSETKNGCTCGSGGGVPAGGSSVEKAWTFFTSKEGITPEHAAGFIGNFIWESGSTELDPNAKEEGGAGQGIVQWTSGGRKKDWEDFAKATNRSKFDFDLQLEFAWFELTGEPPTGGARGGSESAALPKIKETTTVEAATLAVSKYYERPNAALAHNEDRIAAAEQVYKQLHDNVAPAPAAAATGTDSGGCGGGGAGVSLDGFFFPLATTKAQLAAGAEGATWCIKATTNCHHDYKAADIHVASGTDVIAAKPGKVVHLKDQVGGVGSRVVIVDDQYVYYYTHMMAGSLTVSVGQQVEGGTKLGQVGESKQAVGTAPHLHFDMLPNPPYTNRMSCSSASCTPYPFIDVQSILYKVYEKLP